MQELAIWRERKCEWISGLSKPMCNLLPTIDRVSAQDGKPPAITPGDFLFPPSDPVEEQEPFMKRSSIFELNRVRISFGSA